MSNEAYLSLQHSESVVARMAATIYAAYIQRGEITEQNEDEFIRKSVRAAIKLATCTDKVTKSDEEWITKDGGAAPVL